MSGAKEGMAGPGRSRTRRMTVHTDVRSMLRWQRTGEARQGRMTRRVIGSGDFQRDKLDMAMLVGRRGGPETVVASAELGPERRYGLVWRDRLSPRGQSGLARRGGEDGREVSAVVVLVWV